MESDPQRAARAFLEQWDKSHIDGAELLTAVRHACPEASNDDLRAACDTVARGRPTMASANAAAALCQLAGLGDPLNTANKLFNESDRQLTEPQWFAWIAGYSYNWICNSGLRACYFDFDDRQFADRIRVYEAMGASTAAQVLREADRAFGDAGPAPTGSGRAAAISDELYQRLDALGQRFFACGHEIFTRAFLYALEHPSDFAVVQDQAGADQ
jgi:hypothetical protein